MTETELAQLGKLLTMQVGCDNEGMPRALAFWRNTFNAIDYERAEDALKAIMVSGLMAGKDSGKWLAAIVRHCGVVASAPKAYQERPTIEGCETCRFSGCIEVPSHKDWKDGKWRGMYTMVVACTCAMGMQRACTMMSIGQYCSSFPYWQQEYPLRMYEKQYLAIKDKPIPFDKEDAAKLAGRKSWLKKQLGEVA